MNDKNKNIYISCLTLLFLIYIFFSGYTSIKLLSKDGKYNYFGWRDKENVYGFYSSEKSERGNEFNWTQEEGLKSIKIKGETIVIPIFCLKPDIDLSPINIKIFFDDKQVDCFVLDNTDLKYLLYDVTDMGYKIGDTINIKFKIDSLWSPQDYGSEDARHLGIAIGEIKFLN